MLKQHKLLHSDEGITLLEVVATLVVMMLILPAIYTSYITAARASEVALQRLQCLGIARQEIELRKSEGYEDLLSTHLSGPETESTLVQDNFAGSGINLKTTLVKTTITDETEFTSVPALRISVEASSKLTKVDLHAIVVSGGF